LLDTNACEQKRCITLQPVLKRKVWHDNTPKSQLCGLTTSAGDFLDQTFICSHFVTMTQLKTDDRPIEAKRSRFDFAVATILPLG
jgi:hypothetical protein